MSNNDFQFVKASLELEAVRAEFNKYLEIAIKSKQLDKAERFKELASAVNDALLYFSEVYHYSKTIRLQNLELSSELVILKQRNKELFEENMKLEQTNERLFNSKL